MKFLIRSDTYMQASSQDSERGRLSIRDFSNILASRVHAVMLLHSTRTCSLNYRQVHRQIGQNVKFMIILKIKAISFQIYLYILGKSLRIISFPPNIWASKLQRFSHFLLQGIPGSPNALLAISLHTCTYIYSTYLYRCRKQKNQHSIQLQSLLMIMVVHTHCLQIIFL